METKTEKCVSHYPNMISYKPQTIHQYPLYILAYWLLIWLAVFAVLTYFTLESARMTPGYILKNDCIKIQENKETNEQLCVSYSSPYYIPVALEIKRNFAASGLVIGFFVSVFGIGQMMLKSKQQKTKRRQRRTR